MKISVFFFQASQINVIGDAYRALRELLLIGPGRGVTNWAMKYDSESSYVGRSTGATRLKSSVV